MSNFIKLPTDGDGTLWFNIDRIIAINEERGIVYVSNGAGQDVFILTDEGMSELIEVIQDE